MNNSIEASVFDKLSQPLKGTSWKDRLRRLFLTETQNQLEQEKIEDDLYKRIKDLSDEDLNTIALESTQGNSLLKKLQIPFLTKRVVDKFDTFYTSKNIYTVFVLIVSFLYKEITENKISRNKAVKTINYIERIFGKKLTDYPELEQTNLFNHHFEKAITDYQHKKESQLIIPEPLLDILNNPKNLRNGIIQFLLKKNSISILILWYWNKYSALIFFNRTNFQQYMRRADMFIFTNRAVKF